jgi:4-hydroxybenzoate polyprenyltransferase
MIRNKWVIFIKERFDPLTHFLMILVFVTVHILLVNKLSPVSLTFFQILLLLIAVSLFYFKLRLYDEVKDYELDVIINAHRPLPRGLVSHQDMYKGMIFCIFLEIFFFSFQGSHAIISIITAIIYSLLMYKEFFIKDIIRPHLTTYAISHTFVTSLLSMAIFTFINQKQYIENIFDKNFFYFALSNWMLFNIFEFGRKTFAPSEERPNVDTYSSLFGKKLAVILVLSQAIISYFLIISIPPFQNSFITYSIFGLIFLLILTSLFYIITDKEKNAKIYRAMSSVYIIIFYLILIIGLAIN